MAQATRRKSRKPKGRKRGAGSSWLMVALAVVCTGILAALYVGYRQNQPGSFGSGIRSLLEQESAPQARSKAPTPRRTPKPVPKVKLDYHEILPNMDELMSKGDVIDNDKPVDEPQPNHDYILQAGSYRNERDADEMKAKLALVGFEAAVQRVSIRYKGTYYRVMMGPYHSKRKVLLDRKRLQEKGINALAIRLD